MDYRSSPRDILATPTGEDFLLVHAERMGRLFVKAVQGGDKHRGWAPSGERMVYLAVCAFEIRRRRTGNA